MLCVAILMSLGQAARHLPRPFDRLYKRWAIPDSVRKQVTLHRELTEVPTYLSTTGISREFR